MEQFTTRLDIFRINFAGIARGANYCADILIVAFSGIAVNCVLDSATEAIGCGICNCRIRIIFV
jgi:hypothetical protein